MPDYLSVEISSLLSQVLLRQLLYGSDSYGYAGNVLTLMAVISDKKIIHEIPRWLHARNPSAREKLVSRNAFFSRE